MSEKLIFNRPSTKSYIASCIEFKERQEYCEKNLIPLLIKRNTALCKKNKTIESSNDSKEKTIFGKNENNIRTLVNKIKKEALMEYIEINKNCKNVNKNVETKLIMDKIKSIMEKKELNLRIRIKEIENNIDEYKLKYMNDILTNERNADILTHEINELLYKISKLDFSGNSIIEQIDINKIEKYKILSIIYGNVHRFYTIVEKLSCVNNKLRVNDKLKCSEIYEIIKILSECVEYYRNRENKVDIEKSLFNEIIDMTHFIENILANKFLNIMKLYCNWGKIDKIVEEFLSKKNISFTGDINTVNNNIDIAEIEKKEKMVKSLGIILVMSLECNKINNYCVDLNENNDKSKLLNENTIYKIIKYICEEVMNSLKPLFFSKSSLLSNIEKPEWFLQITLSIFMSHYEHLELLWNKFKNCINKEIYLLEKYGNNDSLPNCSINLNNNNTNITNNSFIPFYIHNEKYISSMNEILMINPKSVCGISILNELRNIIKIYIKRILLFKEGQLIRDKKSDYLFERLIEQLLIQYKYCREVDEYSSNIILLDLLTNVNISDFAVLIKNNKDLTNNKKATSRYVNANLNSHEVEHEYEYRMVNVEEITKTAVNLAKMAFSVVIKDKNDKYLDIFEEGKPSEFPSECGILNWFCILNKIYIKNQIYSYSNESLVTCYTDKFNVKRTIKDLFDTICTHSGSFEKNQIIKWFSDTVIYINKNTNIQPLITPIRSLNNCDSSNNNLALTLSYSIETIELLNSFSGKISLFIESCLSIENITNNKVLIYDNQDDYNKYYYINDYLIKNISDKCNVSKTFINEFSIPIIDNFILGEFISYVNFEWNKIGHKVGPFLPITSILLESISLVLSAITSLNEAIFTNKDNNDKNKTSILHLFKNSIDNLTKTRTNMIEDIKLEIKEVLIKPLLFEDIKIPTLDNLIDLKFDTKNNVSYSSFSGSDARLLFNEHLFSKANELEYSFKILNLFLSKSCLDEISQVLHE